jgi:hypothetical protein
MDFRPSYVARGIVVGLFFLANWQPALASADTIDATNHYAWSDNGGWVNWNASNGNVSVTDTALTGYIWSADFGWINLSPTNGGVTNNGQGVLGGYAWGENTGWINFSGITINGSGIFHGSTVAQSVFGTMTFDCTNCLVQTAWRPSGSSGGGSTGGGSVNGGGGNGPPIASSGPRSVGYQPPTPPVPPSQTASTTTAIPPSLVPKTPPPSAQPKTKPPASPSQPSQLASGITLTVSATSSVATGMPIPVSVNITSATKRVQPIAVSYRLYPASGIVAYEDSRTISPTDALQFIQSIPTDTIAPDGYVLAVTAAYGTRPAVTQTLRVSVLASISAYANPSAAPSPTNISVTGTQCSWFVACLWQSITSFFAHLLRT